MFKKIVKGNFNYLKDKRNRVILMTIVFFAISAAVFLIGFLTTGTKKNLLTVVAILGCLPACKSAVNMIMLIRAKGCSCFLHEKIEEVSDSLNMYDMYFTSYKQNFAISSMVVSGGRVIGISEDPKFDEKACVEHLQTMLKNAGHTNVVISLTSETDKYINMLENLAKEEKNDSKRDEEIRISLYEIIL